MPKKKTKLSGDINKLYEIVLCEERRLRLWLSHIAHDYPDSNLAEIARKALAGAVPPPHPLPDVPKPEE